MQGVDLEFVVAPPDVADHISLFYHFRADLAQFEDTERAALAQLRFRLTPGTATYRFADGHEQTAPDIHVIGPTCAASHVRTDGPVRVFGMGITPAGWAAMIGIEASSLLNRVIDATELLGDGVRVAAAALAATQDTATMVEIGRALVHDLVRDRGGEAVGFMRQVDAWLAASPSPDVEHLACCTGLSRRQIERRCNALYGAPPKLLARKYRALKAAVAMVSDHAALDDVLDRGFYDQSHLIREVKQFTGLTPGQIQAEPTLLARMTIGGRAALDGIVSPLISKT